jgi:hypothetical protein
MKQKADRFYEVHVSFEKYSALFQENLFNVVKANPTWRLVTWRILRGKGGRRRHA